MKTTFLTGLLLATTSWALHSQNVNGVSLNIGAPYGGNTISGSYAGAIGNGSTVSGYYSLAVGSQNTIGGYSTIAVGDYLNGAGSRALMVGEWISFDESKSIAVGNSQISSGYATYYGNCNIYVGNYNEGVSNHATAVFGSYHDVAGSDNSLVAGSGHTVSGLSKSMVIGETNVADGQQYLIGKGLIAQVTEAPAVVVGRYNKAQTTPPSGQPTQVFVVGVGASSATNDRRNALEVYTDGTVKFSKRQGDVGMGRFGYTVDQ